MNYLDVKKIPTPQLRRRALVAKSTDADQSPTNFVGDIRIITRAVKGDFLEMQ